MKVKIVSSFLFILAAHFSLYAKLTGRVIDTQSQPISGVRVTVLAKNQSASTDANGAFSIEIAAVVARYQQLRRYRSMAQSAGYAAYSVQGRELFMRRSPGTSAHEHSAGSQIIIQSWNASGDSRAIVALRAGKRWFKAAAQNSIAGVSGGIPALRKAAAIADSVRFEKDGYVTRTVSIDNYTVDLGDIVLDTKSSNWESIFNGINLDGWWIMGNPNIYVKDGQIVLHKTSDGTAGAGYLMTNKDDYMDFEIQFDCKPEWLTDGGVALRDICPDSNSVRGDAWHCCIDYRDKARPGPVGQIYYKDKSEEGSFWRSKWWFVVTSPSEIGIKNSGLGHGFTQAKWQSEDYVGWDENEYQHFLIRFKGVPPKYECYINDVLVNEFQTSPGDPDYHNKAGRIGLQIVQDGNWDVGKKIFFKNIMVREL